MTEKYISPWGYFEIDDSTGLPKLPDGMFYQVKRTIGSYWKVELRRRRKGWLSKKEESVTYCRYSNPLTPKQVLHGSAHALTYYLRRPEGRSDFSLLGDYPPKSLA